MAFVLRRVAAAPVSLLWAVVTDFAGYGRWLPCTQITCDPGPPGVGWSFVGVSGVGRLAFADPMTIEHWEPPGSDGAGCFTVRKRGRMVAGWAEVVVAPGSPGRSNLVWTEEILPCSMRVGRFAAPVSDRANRKLFTRAVGLMVSEAERRAAELNGPPGHRTRLQRPPGRSVTNGRAGAPSTAGSRRGVRGPG